MSVPDLAIPATTTPAFQSAGLIRAFVKHRMARAGIVGLVLITFGVLLGPMLLSAEREHVDLTQIYAAPSLFNPMGTDQLGRDLALRILEGGRVSLWVGLLATILATIIGCSYGVISAMTRGWADRIMMQILDAALAIPILLLVIVSQAFGESSLVKVILVIGLASWMGTARMVRTECRRLLEVGFVQAAITAGTSPLGLIFRHLLPNAFGPLVVVVTVGVGQAILLESTLSFLNLGVPTTLPSWGNLLGNGMSAVLSGAWWPVVFPGLMIVITVLCINLIGDGLRDIVNPKQRDSY